MRMIGAAILLIVVQFASVAANAHAGHGSEGHLLPGHHVQGHGAVAGPAHAMAADESAWPAKPAGQAQPAVRGEATVQNAPGAPSAAADACVMGCCGSTGCCGAALAAVSPDLPAKACALRIGFARVSSVPGVDPRGLRKPPRSLA